MYKTIEKFVEHDNGLCLLQNPTGSGKSQNTFEFIYDYFFEYLYNLSKKTTKKIFFITTRKNNLDYKKLFSFCKNDVEKKELQDKFLYLNSLSEHVYEVMKKDIEFPSAITNLEEFTALKNNLELLYSLENKPELIKFYNDKKDVLRCDIEPKFRRKITELFNAEIKGNYNEKLYAVTNNKDWKWISILYPNCLIKEKQIIFMTIDKLLSKNTPIIDRAEFFYNSKVLDNAILFFDEFDSIKESMSNSIIENAVKHSVDYMDMFKKIHNTLMQREFPAVLNAETMNELANKANEIYEEFNLQYLFKTNDDVRDNGNTFLFQDGINTTVLKKKYLNYYTDVNKNLNTIIDKESDFKINEMINKVYKFMSFFKNKVFLLATDYFHQKIALEEPICFPSAINSVLNPFGLSKEEKDILSEDIIFNSYKSQEERSTAAQDTTYYENGFNLYDIEDSEEHDIESVIRLISVNVTPEKILIKICKNSLIIGLSATLLVDALENFDIPYLEERLGKRLYKPDEDDVARMRQMFNEQNANIDDVKFHVKFVDNPNWKNIFNDSQQIEEKFKILKIDDFKEKRYKKIFYLYKCFLEHEDIKSFLCLMNLFAKRGKSNLDLNVLETYFRVLQCEHGIDTDCFVVLDSNGFDEKKTNITNRLANGEKLFVMSTYQTLGKGQNLQYPVPQNVKTIQIYDADWVKKEKDYDAIYIDKPTHIIPNLNDEMKLTDVIRFICTVEILTESKQLSKSSELDFIRVAIKNFHQKKYINKISTDQLYNSEKTVNTIITYAIQAIGRLCRTKYKSENVYIFADIEFKGIIKHNICKKNQDQIYNREFEEFVKACIAKDVQYIDEVYNINFDKAYRFIKELLNNPWTEKNIKIWNELRVYVLKQPITLISDTISSTLYMDTTSSEIYYKQQYDYKKVKCYKKKENGCIKMSDELLVRLMSIPEIRKHFEEKGYAISFNCDDNEYKIMTPIIYNNIYKGALGEEIGRFILKNNLNINLEEITDPKIFELFDYKVKDKSIFVDFKLWQPSTIFDDEQMIEKIVSKAKKCDTNKVIIINITADKHWIPKKQIKDGITILEIPSLITLNNEYNFKAMEEILCLCQ